MFPSLTAVGPQYEKSARHPDWLHTASLICEMQHHGSTTDTPRLSFLGSKP